MENRYSEMKWSTGAHIAGQAAKQLKSVGQISNIIGLDPTSVESDSYERDKRLTGADADYVQIIRTDGDKFGFSNPLGHGIYVTCYRIFINSHYGRFFFVSADFYPNRSSTARLSAAKWVHKSNW